MTSLTQSEQQTYTHPVSQLLTYGDCLKMEKVGKEWPDYLSLGLTEADIPELIRMATDTSRDEWNEDYPLQMSMLGAHWPNCALK